MSSNIKEINARINDEYCEETCNKLSDDNLLQEYKKQQSVKKQIDILSSLLKKHNISDEQNINILTEYTPKLIPAGTKGVIRGNKFNHIIKDEINSMNLDENLFEICFEKECNLCITSEKPDWYIIEKETKKAIVGMNQLDLWNGGAQSNRGSKYIIDSKYNTTNTKLLCVVCNKTELKSNNKNKTYILFKNGFDNDTLCYIKNLKNIINKFFKLNMDSIEKSTPVSK
jgi:hypothetical protein